MMPGVVAGFPRGALSIPSAPTEFILAQKGWDPLPYYIFEWQAPVSGSPPDGYRVYMRSNSGAYAVQAETTLTSVRVNGVSTGVKQDFYVTAWNSAGESPASNVVTELPS